MFNDGIQPFLNLSRQRIQQLVLFFLRESWQDMIKQGCCGTDKITSASFHGS